MKRLYRQIYLTILVSLALVVMVAGAVWRFAPTAAGYEPLEMAAELIAAALPESDEPASVQAAALQRLARRLGTDLALFDSAYRPIAAAGQPLPPPNSSGPGWIRGARLPTFGLQLPDDRWIVVRPRTLRRSVFINFVLMIGLGALAIALGAYPVVRRLTRRLERLQAGVDTLGSGDFGARVKVEGKDEVARLATSFNRAAGHIEELVGAHRLLLANASHELRTPLARIRLGIELQKDRVEPKAQAALEADIAELDALIDEILLASRLETVKGVEARETIDLLALLAEECARYPAATLDGRPAAVQGDPRLLRRLIRNLLENADRHGRPPVRIGLRREGGRAIVDIADAGPGIPAPERERVFAPFYRLPGSAAATGYGLGLSLVRQIAELHGGTASVEPAGEARTCLRVTLPTA